MTHMSGLVIYNPQGHNKRRVGRLVILHCGTQMCKTHPSGPGVCLSLGGGILVLGLFEAFRAWARSRAGLV